MSGAADLFARYVNEFPECAGWFRSRDRVGAGTQVGKAGDGGSRGHARYLDDPKVDWRMVTNGIAAIMRVERLSGDPPQAFPFRLSNGLVVPGQLFVLWVRCPLWRDKK